MIRLVSKFYFATLILVFAATAFSQTDAAANDKRVRSQVEKLGAGAKVTVKMKDGTKHRGNISQILEDSFDITVGKATQSNIISYREVESVKRRGWTSAAKVAFGVGIGAGVIVAAIIALGSTS